MKTPDLIRKRRLERSFTQQRLGEILLPAHAGVILSANLSLRTSASAPRARGGDPAAVVPMVATAVCSPRTRG